MGVRIAVAGAVLVALVGATIFFTSADDSVLRGPTPTRDGPIVRIEIEAYPEGPPAPPFKIDPGRNALPIRKILRYVPRPLPEPLDQGFNCGFGGVLTITFNGGARVAYGPCHRPSSIDRLWARMVYVITDGGCEPGCGPGRP